MSTTADPHMGGRAGALPMSRSEQKIVQYLDEARASEAALVRVLQSQIAMTPRGRYRSALEQHLGQTREHARRLQRRLGQLRHGSNPLALLVGAAEALAGQALALAKTPVDLLRGSGGEEKVLKNAKDACATEALEIATYTALERLARSVGDTQTATLAASIRADEEKMLAAILREIPNLTEAVVGADVKGARVARKTRNVPSDEPWAGYDELTAAEVQRALSDADDDRAKAVRSYERAHKSRAGVLKAAERELTNA